MFNIALNTFKEIVRNKFLSLILVFALMFILLSLGLGKLSIGEDQKIITDFGIAMIEIFWLLWVLFIGSQLLFREIEWKTIFLILSKPIARYEFILWKFLGFWGIIFLLCFIQSLVYLIVLWFKSIPIEPLILFSLLFIFFKLLILIALVLFFSTFMSNILTILVSLMIYFISHSFTLILNLIFKTKIFILEIFAWFLQLVFPPYEALNTKDFIGGMVTPSVWYFAQNTLYAFLYIALVLFFTILIFNSKKFEE